LKRDVSGKVRQEGAGQVERAMHERKAGTPRSGSSGKKVTSRKQAIAPAVLKPAARAARCRGPGAPPRRQRRSSAYGQRPIEVGAAHAHGGPEVPDVARKPFLKCSRYPDQPVGMGLCAVGSDCPDLAADVS
jgi:hypothetical protein